MENITVDTLLTAEGWDALDLDRFDQLNEVQRQQSLIVFGHYLAVFTGSEQGKFVLADLVHRFLVSEVVAADGADAITIGRRQGRQDAVRLILHHIALAKSGGAPT